MAKKVDAKEQSNKFLNNLIPSGANTIEPLSAPVTTKPAPSPTTDTGSVSKNAALGRKKQGSEVKTRTSFSIDPLDFMNLKRIAFMENKTISFILGEYVKSYIESHQKELDDFSKIPAAFQRKVDASNF